MDEYSELLSRVVSMEKELVGLREQVSTHESADSQELFNKAVELEKELVALRTQIRGAVKMEAPRVFVPGVRVRNTGQSVQRVQESSNQVAYTMPEPVKEPKKARSKDGVEVQVGKTIMSVLASLLIFCSIVFLGILIYPKLTLGAKVAIMYGISIAFAAVGLLRMDSKYKTLFTAIAGCGIGAFYISSVISYFIFGVFGLGVLAVILMLWIAGVAVLSKIKSRLFGYICYVGILVTTCLCMSQWQDTLHALACYLFSISLLFMFNRTGEYRKDVFYYVQFPLALVGMTFYYHYNCYIICGFMLVAAGLYILQHYMYPKKDFWYIICMFATLAVLGVGYLSIADFDSWVKFSNVFFLILSSGVAVWGYLTLGNRACRVVPLCFVVLGAPLLKWGDIYQDFIGFVPFVALFLFVAYMLESDEVKVIALGQFVWYLISPPWKLPDEYFYAFILMFLMEFAILLWRFGLEKALDRYAFLFICGNVVWQLCDSYAEWYIVAMGYGLAVLASIAYNSKYLDKDSASKPIGWIWNGIVMLMGFGFICATTKNVPLLVTYFLLLLVAMSVNMKMLWQSEHIFAGIWACFKVTIYVWLVLDKLNQTGYLLSICGLLIAIASIVIGFYIPRKSFRLYGLILSMVSVAKLLLADIQYSSDVYRPVSMFCAGVLCFGISWIYSRLEKQLKQ